MPTIPEIFEHMPERYKPGVLSADRVYYFSVGPHKYTVRMTPTACTVEPGQTSTSADCVMKTTEKIFEGLVLRGSNPGALDVAMGRFKTSSIELAKDLRRLFTI